MPPRWTGGDARVGVGLVVADRVEQVTRKKSMTTLPMLQPQTRLRLGSHRRTETTLWMVAVAVVAMVEAVVEAAVVVEAVVEAVVEVATEVAQRQLDPTDCWFGMPTHPNSNFRSRWPSNGDSLPNETKCFGTH